MTLGASVQSWTSRRARRTARLGWPVVVSSVFIGVLVVGALAAPLLALHDPNAVDLGATFQSSSGTHLLGTDDLGRDVLSRVIWGARTSLVGPFLIVMFATLVGVSAAVSAAWLGGWYDALITGITDVMLGFPGLLLAIVAVAFFGVGLGAPVVALAVAYAPYFARLTRSVALRERSQAYISALTALGYGGLRISLRHLLPNIAPLILAQAAVSFGYAMVDFAAISFLGLGVQPPTADWGSMVALGQSGILQGHAQVSLAAGAMIVLAVVAFNLLGEGIADRTARGRR